MWPVRHWIMGSCGCSTRKRNMSRRNGRTEPTRMALTCEVTGLASIYCGCLRCRGRCRHHRRGRLGRAGRRSWAGGSGGGSGRRAREHARGARRRGRLAIPGSRQRRLLHKCRRLERGAPLAQPAGRAEERGVGGSGGERPSGGRWWRRQPRSAASVISLSCRQAWAAAGQSAPPTHTGAARGSSFSLLLPSSMAPLSSAWDDR